MELVRLALWILIFFPAIRVLLSNPIKNILFSAVVIMFFTVIPSIGLWARKTWFFFYIYMALPLALLIIVPAIWFGNLFGDQAQSLFAVAAHLWPILLYFGGMLVLTISLQRHTNHAGRQSF